MPDKGNTFDFQAIPIIWRSVSSQVFGKFSALREHHYGMGGSVARSLEYPETEGETS